VFEWHKGFKEGEELLQDDEWKARPSPSRTDESTEVIQKCLFVAQTLSIGILEEMTGINRQTVHKILVKNLGGGGECMLVAFHVCYCWIKTALSVEFVDAIDDNRNVLIRILMGDENGCFMYNPERKYQECKMCRVQRN
jgi:hypothetical protein